MHYPKITIVTPNYNQSNFLEQTINSVISQNYPNLEYIIIDGGSTDGSIDIIKKYENYLSYWVSEVDNGMYEAIQKGFERSTGEIMAWLNSDDMYHSNALFTVAEIFSTFDKVKWLTGCNTNFDELGRTINTHPAYQQSKYDLILSPSRHIQQESTFWLKELWVKAGGTLPLESKYAGDFELWMRFFRYEQLYVTDALIGGFRFRKNQISQLYEKRYKQECDIILTREKNIFSFFDICMLKEFTALHQIKNYNKQTKLQLSNLKSKLKKIAQYPDRISFDPLKQKFILEDSMMNENQLIQAMYRKRNNIHDFLKFLIEKHKYYPEVILDVGVAQGTQELYEIYPNSHFILFEALEEFMPDMKRIQDKLERVDIELCAIGASEGSVSINIHPDLDGSSIYEENEESDVNGIKRQVEIKRLDYFKDKYHLNNKSILLKIDVQGAELDVLRGAEGVLEFVEIIVLEVSLYKFFKSEVTLAEIISYMNKIDYVIYDIFGFLNRPIDSALAQVDLAFVKKKSSFKEKHYFATNEQRIILNNRSKQHQIVDEGENFQFSKKFNKFYSMVETLKNKKEKYIIYGHGTIGKTIFNLIPENVLAFVDLSSDLKYTTLIRGEVYNPGAIEKMDFDKIIISVFGREESIINYLVKEHGIKYEDIITFDV